jgi:hypothetical protein
VRGRLVDDVQDDWLHVYTMQRLMNLLGSKALHQLQLHRVLYQVHRRVYQRTTNKYPEMPFRQQLLIWPMSTVHLDSPGKQLESIR